MAEHLLFDRVEFGFGLQPDVQIAAGGLALFQPELVGAMGDFFVGDVRMRGFFIIAVMRGMGCVHVAKGGVTYKLG